MNQQQKLTFFIKKRRAIEPSKNKKGGLERDSERLEKSVQYNKSISWANSNFSMQ